MIVYNDRFVCRKCNVKLVECYTGAIQKAKYPNYVHKNISLSLAEQKSFYQVELNGNGLTARHRTGIWLVTQPGKRNGGISTKQQLPN